jgi:hypothetical protein
MSANGISWHLFSHFVSLLTNTLASEFSLRQTNYSAHKGKTAIRKIGTLFA